MGLLALYFVLCTLYFVLRLPFTYSVIFPRTLYRHLFTTLRDAGWLPKNVVKQGSGARAICAAKCLGQSTQAHVRELHDRTDALNVMDIELSSHSQFS